MTLAATDWLSISINLLLILFTLVCLLMSLLIMMQRPKQEGLGAAFGSGMTDQMFGARTTNVLQKGTVYLATLFFVLTLALAILIARQNDNQASLVKDEPEAIEEPAAIAPVDAPDLPVTGEAGDSDTAVVDEAPAAEETPAGEDAAAATDEPTDTDVDADEASDEPAADAVDAAEGSADEATDTAGEGSEAPQR